MLDRRHFMTTCAGLGLGSTLLPGVLWALAEEKGKVTADLLDSARSGGYKPTLSTARPPRLTCARRTNARNPWRPDCWRRRWG